MGLAGEEQALATAPTLLQGDTGKKVKRDLSSLFRAEVFQYIVEKDLFHLLLGSLGRKAFSPHHSLASATQVKEGGLCPGRTSHMV